MDDAIVNGTLDLSPGTPAPLALFRAARVDYSLHRLYHYTGTDPEHFQNFVIFTNYQFYVDAFALICRERVATGHPACDAFVEPGNVITRGARLGGAGPIGAPPERMPQMPAFHLVERGCGGITMINIGTGPSNARNITDHVAVMRPHAWLMLGHCAGLRSTQKLGDYVLLTWRHGTQTEFPNERADPAVLGGEPTCRGAFSADANDIEQTTFGHTRGGLPPKCAHWMAESTVTSEASASGAF